ncbi:39S ribosomal protein L52, mitochondrial [Pectinophora gossypiella]|uniref:39S ribosomal protein L52, mitochondrial n=1 Tax=Pectinophora gossypiella TaxID=13191 RepID=UPI00214F278A|nr:39S ribosomal protein L52, mitochondrial [Pectinophora gossypiella]
MLKPSFGSFQLKLATRAFSCSPAVSTKEWRVSKGLPINRNAEGILTDGPDYTFLDGRPTPLLHKQKQRMLKQQGYASRIVELCSELEFAKTRHQGIIKEEQEKRASIIRNRLKAKGNAFDNK